MDLPDVHQLAHQKPAEKARRLHSQSHATRRRSDPNQPKLQQFVPFCRCQFVNFTDGTDIPRGRWKLKTRVLETQQRH